MGKDISRQPMAGGQHAAARPTRHHIAELESAGLVGHVERRSLDGGKQRDIRGSSGPVAKLSEPDVGKVEDDGAWRARRAVAELAYRLDQAR